MNKETYPPPLGTDSNHPIGWRGDRRRNHPAGVYSDCVGGRVSCSKLALVPTPACSNLLYFTSVTPRFFMRAHWHGAKEPNFRRFGTGKFPPHVIENSYFFRRCKEPWTRGGNCAALRVQATDERGTVNKRATKCNFEEPVAHCRIVSKPNSN